jgi:hypothetical protein
MKRKRAWAYVTRVNLEAGYYDRIGVVYATKKDAKKYGWITRSRLRSVGINPDLCLMPIHKLVEAKKAMEAAR